MSDIEQPDAQPANNKPSTGARVADGVATVIAVIFCTLVALVAGFTIQVRGSFYTEPLPDGLASGMFLLFFALWCVAVVAPAIATKGPRVVYPLGASVIMIVLALMVQSIWPA